MKNYRYYREQLQEDELKIYDEFVKNILEFKKSFEIPKGSVNKGIWKIIKAIGYDMPQLFYLNFYNTKVFSDSQKFYFEIDYNMSKDQAEIVRKAISREIDSILKHTKGLNQHDKALYLHDRLVRRCIYNSINTATVNCHNIIGPFLDYECVCEGFSKAYKFLADLSGLKCISVTGDAINRITGKNESHAWNMIEIDGKNYFVDVTFDNLIEDKFISRLYFKLSTEEITNDRSFDLDFKIPEAPVSGSLLPRVNNTRELLDFIKKEYDRGVNFSEVRLQNPYKNINELIDDIHKELRNEELSWYTRRQLYFYYSDLSDHLRIVWENRK